MPALCWLLVIATAALPSARTPTTAVSGRKLGTQTAAREGILYKSTPKSFGANEAK